MNDSDILAFSDVPAAAQALAAAVCSYAAGVDMLKGPLEADVQEASEACWTMDSRLVQVKSKLLVSFRTRHVKVIVPEFISEAEQQLLGAALKQWQSSAEGVVASSILEVKVAEQRLLHAVHRLIQQSGSDASTILTLLSTMLTSAAEYNEALASRCPSARHSIRQLALLAGMRFLDLSADETDGSQLKALVQLIQVLQQHAGQASWAASLLQASASQLPGVLPSVLQMDSKAGLAADSDASPKALAPEGLTACKVLFAQLPWEDIAQLEVVVIRTDVQLPLIQFLTTVAMQAEGNAGASDLMHSAMTALLLIAFKVPEMKVEIHGALQVGVLAVATGGSVQAVLDMLGGSIEGIVDADLLPWAQLAWGAGGGQRDTAAAASLVQRLDWQEMAFTLPGKLGTRALLTLTAVAGAVVNSPNERIKQQYMSWLWNLLLSPVGRALVKLDSTDMEDAEKLCLAEAPDRSDAVQAVWAWIQLQLAVGLLEHWATSTEASQGRQHAKSLLDGMDFFALPQTLVKFAQAEAVVLIMLRYVDAAAAFGERFFRLYLAALGTALGPSLQAPTHGGSSSGMVPIKQNLQRLIKRGIVVNEATQTPNKNTPDSSPPDSPRTPPPPKRGSTTSPGQEALIAGGRWLAILVCCHHKSGLDTGGLSLINDLVQLLYYHGSGVAQNHRDDQSHGIAHLLSPVVQECMEMIAEALEVSGVQSLWAPLMQLEAANARQLQWLAVLACWLSNTVHTPAAADPAEHSRQPAVPSPPVTAADSSQDCIIQQKPSSSPSIAQEGSLAGGTAEASVDEAPVEVALHAGGGSAPQDSEYPGTPSLTPASAADTMPPPSYSEAIGQQASAISIAGHAAKPGNHRVAGDSPVSRTAPHGSSGAESRAGQHQHDSPEAIDRSAEEALQIQEAAVGIGYGAAALELWEEFVIRFFRYETQLGAVVPKQDIANHLQQLAHLYESSSPVLSNIYALLSCLSPDQVPGGTPRFVAENRDALRSLMQLHPLNLTKPDNTTISQPPSPNPLLDTNPFGAVPLSALLQSPPTSLHTKQASRGGDSKHLDSDALVAQTPEGPRRPSAESGRAVLEPSVFQQQAAMQASSFDDLVTQQESMDEDITTSRAALRPWARRAEKQAARARSSSPGAPRRSGSSRRTGSSDLQGAVGLSRQFSSSNTVGSGERNIQSYLARSSRDGDVPDIISQAQGKLWDMTSAWSEEMERIHAGMREMVCRRYKHVDLERIANGEVGEVEEVHPLEDPTYRQHLNSLRDEALKVVLNFTSNPGLVHVARLLYQLEVLLLHSSTPKKEADRDDKEVEVECKCQLLLVLAEVTLDGSSPLICTPMFATLFCQAASGAVPIGPQTKVKLCRRILHALASNSQPQQQEREAVTLLKASLDPETLLTTSSMQDYEACLDTVLFHSHRLLPATVTSLLGCFHLSQYAGRLLQEQPGGAAQAEAEGITWSREEIARAPPGVTKVLNLALATLSLKGGAATGRAVLQGLLVTGPASYYAAVLQLAITGEEEEGRQAAVDALQQMPVETLPLSVVLDSLLQVAEALNSNQLVPPHIPHALLHSLMQTTSLLAALRSIVAGGNRPAVQDAHETSGEAFWSAKVGSTRAEDEGGRSAGRGKSHADSQGEVKQAVLVVPVHMTAGAGECLQHLVGAWLQSILRKFGSGLDPMAFTEEFTCLLSSLFEPAGSHPWLVDWLWTVYQAVLQPFLALAGPASDGIAVTRFREYWQSLPWHKATFHCISPDALRLLASFLFSSDRAVLQLLHVLDWRPVLQQLSPVAARIQPTHPHAKTGDESSLLDDDMTVSQPSGGAESASPQHGNIQSAQGLDAGAKAWAAQLLLLVLQAYVIMTDADMPAWISRLIKGDTEHDAPSGNDDTGNLWLTSHLRLPHIFAAAELATLQQTLCKQGPSGTPFLLQPFVTSPNLVKADPNPRLLTLGRLLTHGAKLNGSAKAAAVAATAIQHMMLVSVCRGFHTLEGSEEHSSEGSLEILECWHLSSDELSSLVRECLLPLAEQHASLGLAQSLQAEEIATSKAETNPGPESKGRWQAPALSSLVSRLAQPPGKPPQPRSPSWHQPPPQAEEVFLDASSDEEDKEAAPVRPGPEAGSQELNLSIYSAAAGPFKALLACVEQAPGVLVTLEPLPFANAEGPLQLLSTGQQPAHHTQASHHQAEAQAVIRQHSSGQSPAKPAAVSGSMSSLKARMVALKKGMGIGTADIKGTKLPLAAAATDAGAIQQRLAIVIHEAAQHQPPEFTLSLLRVIFTASPSANSPVASALTEDLLLGLLLRRQGSSRQQPLRSETGTLPQDPGSLGQHWEPVRDGLARQGSYTEVLLGTPQPAETDLVSPLEAAPTSTSGRTAQQTQVPVLTCLEGLPQHVVVGLCQAGATGRMPLTVALASEKARQHAAGLDSLAWRDLAADIVEATTKAEGHPAAPVHVIAPWLEVLLWLADARWRKLGTAAPVEQVRQLLDCLQGHVALLWTAVPSTPGSQEHGLFSSAAERLRLARSEVKARLNRGESGSGSAPATPTSPIDSARQGRPSSTPWGSTSEEGDTEGSKLRTGLMDVLKRHTEPAGKPGVTPAPAAQSKPGRFANLRAKLSKPSEHAEGPQPELEPESRLSSKLTGFKNRLLKPSAKPQSSLDESHSGASGATPSYAPGVEPSPLDSAYDFGALAADSRDAGAGASTASRPNTDSTGVPGGASTAMPAAFRGQQLHYQQSGAAADSSAKPNLTDRMTGNFRKAMGITAKEPDTAKRIPPDSEASQATAQAAANMVQIGFVAFAVSAYIRSSLCPDLQSYSPQPMRLTAQADIKLGDLAPYIAPAAGGQYILHHTKLNFASMSAPHQSSTPGTNQVRPALMHISLCEPTKQSRCSNVEGFPQMWLP
ncbi:TPA: hypothetical protein ACH3X1_001448 [Trebouxia sp. C0004]